MFGSNTKYTQIYLALNSQVHFSDCSAEVLSDTDQIKGRKEVSEGDLKADWSMSQKCWSEKLIWGWILEVKGIKNEFNTMLKSDIDLLKVSPIANPLDNLSIDQYKTL